MPDVRQHEALPGLHLVSGVLLLQGHRRLQPLRVLPVHVLLPLPREPAPAGGRFLPLLRIVRYLQLLYGEVLLRQAAGPAVPGRVAACGLREVQG